jgi:hypothetical protein
MLLGKSRAKGKRLCCFVEASNGLAILVLAWCFEKLPDTLKNFHQYFLVPTQYFPLRVNSTRIWDLTSLCSGLDPNHSISYMKQ